MQVLAFDVMCVRVRFNLFVGLYFVWALVILYVLVLCFDVLRVLMLFGVCCWLAFVFCVLLCWLLLYL